ncbi:hypothetical protein BZG36_00203 [Bifiguratus adelaidae]|uniref:Cytochrome P450 n=1 Tax=Bifiguratus adelaidae TaxID=1938954 RepID=A0A261Y8V7_9FUNG|nr:hypothetical protein BZG36_00203 [Bifiguratus adelaidae]
MSAPHERSLRLCIYKVFYILFFDSRRNIPGSLVDRIIYNHNFAVKGLRGKIHEFIDQQHNKYGRIVYVAPDIISVDDRKLVKYIISQQDFPKSEVYENLRLQRTTLNLFNVLDRDYHKHIRRSLAPAFALSYLNSLEPMIQSCIDVLIKVLNERIDQSPSGVAVVDMWQLITYLALDTIGETAFGFSFNMVESGKKHPLSDAIEKCLRNCTIANIIRILQYVPGIDKHENYFRKVGNSCDIAPVVTTLPEEMTAILNRRKAFPSGRRDILQIMIDTQSREDGMTDEQIIQESAMFHVAGSETSSNTINFGLIYLAKHRKWLEALQQELDEAFPTAESVHAMRHENLKNLTILNAVINETMRLRPVTMVGIARQTPETTTLGPYVLPKHTQIIVNYARMQRDKEYWGEDANEYNPARFLGDWPSDAFLPFSASTRSCIGKNFALLQMRLTLAHIIRRYNLDIVPGQNENDLVQHITVHVRGTSYKMAISRRDGLSENL